MVDETRGAGISLLVPYRNDGGEGRRDNWDWLRQYWEHTLPEAEIILGDAPGNPFSKTCAINAAFRKSTGDVLVQIDADCYIDPAVILDCAKEIRIGRGRAPREEVWFVPFRHLYRLNRPSTLLLIGSDPCDPFRFGSPPDEEDVGPTSGSGFGHWYGALIQIYPREAFEMVHGMDARFRGWGGEDISFTFVLDTLFGEHRTTDNQVLTLFHTIQAKPKTNPDLLRLWDGQEDPRKNWNLAGRYRTALRNPEVMRGIVEEWTSNPQLSQHLIHPSQPSEQNQTQP